MPVTRLSEPAGLPPDLVWRMAGSEVGSWRWVGDDLLLRLAVGAVHGTLDAGHAPTDGHLLPLWVRCEGVAASVALPEHGGALGDGQVDLGGHVLRELPVPGAVTAPEGGELCLTLTWRQGMHAALRCRAVKVVPDASSRLIESWAC
ncbi:hypothetical protein [uncultured Aquabacterium sp.]|uniref:hypothetical protein n=1 Tax=Aquabacterium sp. TaxID=1872578 RepID=UPI0025D94500|nr:hypothetical protein [uncultured Aquabacterium sp.]